MIVKIKLSDGKPCQVRQLGIFELDPVVPAEELGPFFYEVTMMDGSKAKEIYTVDSLARPPAEPKIPRHEVQPKTRAFEEWLEYDTYKAALAHYEHQHVVTERYNEAVRKYILTNALVNRADIQRIVTADDWHEFFTNALIAEVDENLIAYVLDINFKASYGGMPVLSALQAVEGTPGQYVAVKKWEAELMLELKLSEEEYSKISVIERARKIVAMKLDDWMSVLDSERMRIKSEAERARRSKSRHPAPAR